MSAIFFLLFIGFTLFLTPYSNFFVFLLVCPHGLYYIFNIVCCAARQCFFLLLSRTKDGLLQDFLFAYFGVFISSYATFFLFLNYNLFLQAFAQLLQAPHDDAGVIMKERFPVPRLVICDQHGSQVGSYHNVQQMGGSLWMIVVCYLLSPGKDILGHSPMDVCT